MHGFYKICDVVEKFYSQSLGGNKSYEILTMSKAASLASCQRELLLLNVVKSLFTEKFYCPIDNGPLSSLVSVWSVKGLHGFFFELAGFLNKVNVY